MSIKGFSKDRTDKTGWSPLSAKFSYYAESYGVRYSEELAIEICAHVASGKSLTSYCRDKEGNTLPGRPSLMSVYRWFSEIPAFKALYDQSREDRVHVLAEETIDIADNPEIDHRQAKNMIDARKWYTARLMPHNYGDRVAVTGAKDGAPITIGREPVELSDADLLAIAQGTKKA